MNLPSIFDLGRRVAVVLLAATFTAACATSGDPSGAGDSDDEVQVGYGTQDEADVTGSVQSVTAEDVVGQKIARLEDLIEGRVSGVSVQRHNGGISIRIRGTSTFLGDGEPLYVIDGSPIHAPPGVALMGVNPRDIERIDVLKDAGATAIYGSRGANGVVLITTKRPN